MRASVEKEGGAGAAGERAARAYRFADLSGYSFRERLLIRAADLAFYLVIGLAGRTARFRVEGREHWEAAHAGGPPIMAFWHDQIFLTTYYFRRRGIVVMTSQSFDGEYIARFIQRFGYGAARGSSTRGGVGALVEMARLVRAGRPAGFTADGPRGPRHAAKPGPLLLAKKTGRPVLPFAVNAEKFWTLPSWDRLQIPRPFTRATVRVAPPISVPPDADDRALEQKREELQRALDAVSGDS
ncbi:MAG TPA: lysophospholipid acyltransferase family protein [Pyrinomonadaceae bacterium]|nr:lysophospholipid acyltransferase family protein [Pyrinomonadaceae bacterium]